MTTIISPDKRSVPWLYIWFRPRAVIKDRATADPRRHAILIAMTVGIIESVSLGIILQNGAPVNVVALGLMLIAGGAGGVAWLGLGGVILQVVGGRLGGRASIEEVRAALVGAATILYPMVMVMLAFSAVSWFDMLPKPDGGPSPILVFAGLWLGLNVWSGLVLVVGLAEVQYLSRGRAFFSVILSILVIQALIALAAFTVVVARGVISKGVDSVPPVAILAVAVMFVVFSLIMALRSSHKDELAPAVDQMSDWFGEAQVDLVSVELSRPRRTRLVLPIWEGLKRTGTRLTPSDHVQHVHEQLILGGQPGNLSVADFLGLRFLLGAGAALAMLIFVAPTQALPNGLVFTFAAFAVGMYIPTYWLNGRIKKRQKAIQHALPDALDMLATCVGAGLGFDAAMQRVAYKWSNELALELRRVVHETRVGVERAQALQNMVARTQVRDLASFVAIIVQAERMGVSIGKVLNSQSEQLRIRRRQRAEEEARKAPVKMLLPMTLFILPATFLTILGPAAPRFMRMFSQF